MPAPQEITFTNEGESCGAWWYAAAGQGPHPAIVMAHGLGATRELGLDAYAQRFCAAGISVLAIDYRHYGASSGAPRELLSIARQLSDFRAAIACVKTLPHVDGARIAIWGSSFAGGHVIKLAQEDLGLRAAVSQVPFSDGLASTLRIAPWTALRLTVVGIWDVLKSLLGLAPAYVLLVGRPGELALMSAPDCADGYGQLIPEETRAAGRWNNRVAARIALTIPFHTPARGVARTQVPLLIAVADNDSIAPASPTIAAAQRSNKVQLVRYPGGHFDYYKGAGFERAVNDELDFLKTHLAL